MRRRAGLAVPLFACLTVFSCDGEALSRASIAVVAGQVAQVAAALSGQRAPIAEEVAGTDATASRSYMGFDTGWYPGDAALLAWRTGGAPYEWAGYYLPSPCHPDDGWSGKRERLTAMGYGLAVLYVGQQTWGRTPGKPYKIPVKVTARVKTRVGKGRHRRTVWKRVTRTVLRTAPPPKPTESCNADYVTATRGAREGLDAVARTEREGFPRGTTVFLDLERMDAIPTAMREYYSAWVRAVLADGRYRPGIYVHTDNADTVYADVKRAYTDAGIRDEPPFWIAKSAGFDVTKLPNEMGHAFAAVWQGVLDVEQEWAGQRINIDVNVAHSRSPSTPALAFLGQALTGSRAGD